MASTVAPSYITPEATKFHYQRKSFHAEGRFWVFYCDGSNIAYNTSPDGSNWAFPTTIRGSVSKGSKFAIFFDGTYFHYAFYDEDNDDRPLYYRRGTPASDGSISWSAAEQIAKSAEVNKRWEKPNIIVDSDGYPWIFYRKYEGTGRGYPMCTKSSTNDGTWSTEGGFPYTIIPAEIGEWYVAMGAVLTDGKVYAIAPMSGGVTKGRLWTGSWGAIEDVTSSSMGGSEANNDVTSLGDDVHYVGVTGSTNLIHVKREYGVGWGGETAVATISSSGAPSISACPTSSELYVFWLGVPSADHVYYKKYSSGSWGGTVDWLTESNVVANNVLSSFYQVYGGYLGVIWLIGTGSPWNVRFAFLEIPAGGGAGAVVMGTKSLILDLLLEGVID